MNFLRFWYSFIWYILIGYFYPLLLTWFAGSGTWSGITFIRFAFPSSLPESPLLSIGILPKIIVQHLARPCQREPNHLIFPSCSAFLSQIFHIKGTLSESYTRTNRILHLVYLLIWHIFPSFISTWRLVSYAFPMNGSLQLYVSFRERDTVFSGFSGRSVTGEVVWL